VPLSSGVQLTRSGEEKNNRAHYQLHVFCAQELREIMAQLGFRTERNGGTISKGNINKTIKHKTSSCLSSILYLKKQKSSQS
jgi:hypothetical protein